MFYDINLGFFVGITISFIFLFILYFTKSFHIQYTADNNHGPQKIHNGQVMRIGGLITLPSYFLASYFFENQLFLINLSLILIPTVFLGLKEDFYKNVPPIKRLFGILLTSFLIIFFLKIFLTDFAIIKINHIILIYFITILGLTTISNAFNIIDGLNGLSLGTTIINLSFIFLISLKVQDGFTQNLSLFLIFPFIVIFVFNFPFAKVFSGDAGAYVMGISVGITSILISENNSLVNPFCSLLIIIYPLYECVRSFFRRIIAKRRIDYPDNYHFHSLVYQLFKHRVPNKFANPLSSLLVLLLPLSSSTWAYLNFNNQNKLIFGVIIFLVFYELTALVVSKNLKNKKIIL